jgi:hypothetical protein
MTQTQLDFKTAPGHQVLAAAGKKNTASGRLQRYRTTLSVGQLSTG